jgi:hypothetical protein
MKKASCQIGGKGSVRRKKIPAKEMRKFLQRKTTEQLNFERRLKDINRIIQKVNTEDKVLLNTWILTFIEDYFTDLERTDLKKKEDYKRIRDDPIDFFKKECMTENLFNLEMYVIFKKYFIDECIPHLLDMFKLIQSGLERETYKEENKDKIEMTETECYSILGLDVSKVPTKIELKKVYRKLAMKNHPDKHPQEKEKYEKLFADIAQAYEIVGKTIK